jgi:hypothetical protein
MNWLQRSKYGYLWITPAFSLIGHWLFGWLAYVNEQQAHNAPVEASDCLIQMSRDMLEIGSRSSSSWFWHVADLAILLYVGSQSREGDERKEAKLGCGVIPLSLTSQPRNLPVP